MRQTASELVAGNELEQPMGRIHILGQLSQNGRTLQLSELQEVDTHGVSKLLWVWSQTWGLLDSWSMGNPFFEAKPTFSPLSGRLPPPEVAGGLHTSALKKTGRLTGGYDLNKGWENDDNPRIYSIWSICGKNTVINHTWLGMVNIPPIHGEIGDGLLLFYHHYHILPTSRIWPL